MHQVIGPDSYQSFEIDSKTSLVIFRDCLGGFDSSFRSPVLDRLISVTNQRPITVQTEYLPNENISKNYPSLDLKFDLDQHHRILNQFYDYRQHPEIDFKNFICSFNGTPHVSRKLLVAALHKMGWYNKDYSSKTFDFSKDELSGHLTELTGDLERFYTKFFIGQDSDNFFAAKNEFNYTRFDHRSNIIELESKITQSFVHLVSESHGTAYWACYGEKFLYSVVTRGLFVCYAPPYYHNQLFDCHGFKPYNTIFNYDFDVVSNPVERLIAILEMLGKYANLDKDDWMDLYQMESDTIEYNYNHYFSKNYIKCLERLR